MDFKVIVTVGGALLGNPEKLKKIDSCGDCIYRINGAHTDPANLASVMKTLRVVLGSPRIMVDLPGNKIRTQGLPEPICLAKGEMFDLQDYQTNYPDFYSNIRVSDLILANDSTITLEVKEIAGSAIRILSHSDGLLHNNKGLHVPGICRKLPFLFERDKELIKIASSEKADYISLSFVRKAEDIVEAKKMLASCSNRGARIVAKIETADAVDNLGYIFKEVDNVNIDRGDLSADIGMMKLPAVQDRIIESARRAGKNVYLATQFLKNMEHSPVPLIAEIMDLHKTIKSGVSGIQLSEETALGKHPVECVKLVFDIFNSSFSG